MIVSGREALGSLTTQISPGKSHCSQQLPGQLGTLWLHPTHSTHCTLTAMAEAGSARCKQQPSASTAPAAQAYCWEAEQPPVETVCNSDQA